MQYTNPKRERVNCRKSFTRSRFGLVTGNKVTLSNYSAENLRTVLWW